jgi:HlyD family secretion protein
MLKEAKDDLSKTEIYSPMKGVVSQLNKEKGEMVLGASFQEDVIMIVADLTKMEAEVEVDENDVVNVERGDTAKIEIDAFPDTLFKGIVTRIANTGETRGLGTQEEITNFKVEIGILDKIIGIRPGMSATVDIQVEKHDSVLFVPIQCVAMRSPEDTSITAKDSLNKKLKGKKSKKIKGSKDDKPGELNQDKSLSKDKSEKEKMVEVIFMVGEGDTARIIPIKTGISSDTDIEILSELKVGEKIISGPYRILATKIKHGDKVKEEKFKKEENQQRRD